MDCESEMLFYFNQISHLVKVYAIREMRWLDLKPSQVGILIALSGRGELSQQELAKRIGITAPSMTVALQKMEKLGYITRTHDEDDQRVIRISITEKGRADVEYVKSAIGRMKEIIMKDITLEEKLIMRRVMMQVRDNLLKSEEMQGVDMEQGCLHFMK